ncbi:MAG TPA: hypothetical protein VIO64_20865 [Pseudobacteroides sp.]|uniref:hypothetical protein n=1 Tax=Pseudobacteroides sp. TaxID=1968840 RepID=UPI002F95321F
MNDSFSSWMLIPLFILLFIQGAWIFNDASKRGENKWIWGFFGLLNVPSNLIIYLIVTRVWAKACPCQICGKKFRNNYKYCPHCGASNSSFGKNK